MSFLKKSLIRQLILLSSAAILSMSAMATDFSQTQALAQQGDIIAQYNLGGMYKNGTGVPQSYVKAVEWYTKAANQGVDIAQFNLGVMYEDGEGVRQNNTIAQEWFGKSCDNRFQEGCDAYQRLNQW